MDYGVPMISVLVDDAIMPRAHDIPADIKNFVYNNAVTVDAGKDFRALYGAFVRTISTKS